MWNRFPVSAKRLSLCCISLYLQIVLAHTLRHTVTNPLPPILRHHLVSWMCCSVHRHQSLSLSDFSSLRLSSSVFLSPSLTQPSSLCIALYFNLCVSISLASPLTRTPVALRDTCSPISFCFNPHTHIHTQTFKPLSFILSPSFYDCFPPIFSLEPSLTLRLSHSLLIFLPVAPQAISLLKWIFWQI